MFPFGRKYHYPSYLSSRRREQPAVLKNKIARPRSGVTARSSVARPVGQQEESNLIADILLYIYLGWGRVSRPHRSETVMIVTLCPALRPAPCFGAVV